MTDMGCSQALMDQDSWLVEFFSDKPTLSLEGDYLTFAGASATLIFMDSEVAIPDRVLVGSTWTVDTFIDGETASTSNLEEYPTLLFNENGTVEVFTGCNDGDGRYTVSGDQLTFSSLSYTRRSCANEVVASAEYHVMGVLAESDLTFGIDATRLTIQSLTIGLSATTD
jgi:heat shock protein HslJ